MNRLNKFLVFVTGVIILICLFDFRIYENMDNKGTPCEDLQGCNKTKINSAINYLKTKLPEKLKKKLESLNSEDISPENLFSLAEEFKEIDPDPKDIACGKTIAECYTK